MASGADYPCPCGEDHSSAPAWPVFLNAVCWLPKTAVVFTPHGAWHVPRVYIAFHGIAEAHMAALAARYNFEPVARSSSGMSQ